MRPGLIVALDDPDLPRCEALAKELSRKVSALKVGLTLFAAHGPEAILEIGQHGPVFCDLKLHDIPSQVGAASREVARHGVWMFTVHASGGEEMVAAAVSSAAQENDECLVAAVTVLTSHSTKTLTGVGRPETASDRVERLARLAVGAGAKALVCSGEEVGRLRSIFGPKLNLVVPGIRPEGTPRGDQARVVTPAEAAAAGADYIVVGRAITEATDPGEAANRILRELTG